MDQTNNTENSKFTRGEKCIFYHIIVTFVLILLLTILYFIHLSLVTHTKDGIFTVERNIARTLKKDSNIQFPIGVVYLNITPVKFACNVLLLRLQWSIAPAHCTSMRSDPDMAYLIFTWKVKYENSNSTHKESNIIRSITHPHFNRDDFANNIGLFEHSKFTLIDINLYTFSNDFTLNDDTLSAHANDMSIVGLEPKLLKSTYIHTSLKIQSVHPLTSGKCHKLTSSIVDLRSYEFCVMPWKRNICFEHGAVLIMNSKVIGIFTWGDKYASGIPSIIINIISFKDWLEYIIAL